MSRRIISFRPMPFWLAISRLLTVLAVVSLIAGAWTQSAMAGSMTGNGVAVVAVDSMPSCDPPQQTPDCQKMARCLYAAVCAKCGVQGAAAAALIPPHPRERAPRPKHD